MTERKMSFALRGPAVLLAFVAACGGGSGGGSGGGGGGGALLVEAQYGRLVDVYAYRRIDPSVADRRAKTNRNPVLIAREVIIDPEIESQPLFDSVGAARPTASYQFMPFDVSVGHDELLILWDDQHEAAQFEAAFAAATADASLPDLAPAYRDQNILLDPMPIVPRNAAIKLTFSAPLGLTTEFFRVNPAAIQVLRFLDDPNVVPPTSAFEPAEVRILADGGPSVIIDTSIIGGESLRAGVAGRTTPGLEASPDRLTANYRIAIPTQGIAARQLNIAADQTPEQNGVDSRGDAAVIRDFRSGNPADGRIGALVDFENPTIVALPRMGITAIDVAQRTVTIHKRGRNFAIRGRYPFVDGVVDVDTRLPKGPNSVPTVDQNGTAFPLPSGDFVVQTVVSPVTGEALRIRGEVLQVLEVGTIEGDAAFAGPGLTAAGTDGGELATIRARLTNVSAFDSQGNEVFMQADDQSAVGANCFVQVRYYEALRYGQGGGSVVLSDAERRAEFIEIDGTVAGPGPTEGLSPITRLAFRFSEPMDLAAISPLDNYVLTYEECNVANFPQVIAEPKAATLNILYTRLVDKNGDATLLSLDPPEGMFHAAGQTEVYWLHADLGQNGLVDYASNLLDVFDRRQPGTTTQYGLQVDVPLRNLSVRLSLDPAADDNWAGSRVFRFAEADEDGTKPGSIDYFGQFRISEGRLSGAAVTRRSATADGQNLGSIQRWDKGECVLPGDPVAMTPPVSQPPLPGMSYGPGVLYETPNMSTVQITPPVVFQPPQGPQPFGGIVEPHTSRGARMQMTYREDDFGLSYHDANDLNIDVEQLHWAPWADGVVLFDRFDRYTMRLAHSKKRPDRLFAWQEDTMAMPPVQNCGFDCLSLFSGLSTRFDDNVLRGAAFYGTVARDKEYVIDPNRAFRAASGIKYVPYPDFDETYTWRDSRLVSWDAQNDQAIGLGGAQDAVSNPPDGDRTASISSPWIQDDPTTAHGLPTSTEGWQFEQLVRDQADFLGDRTTDHDPIALPLLVDISVWPETQASVANAGNLFHIAYLGPIWVNPPPAFNGYYNLGGGISTATPLDPFNCNGIDWPFLRVYTFGGPDPNVEGRVTLIEPDKQLVARGGVIKDMGVGDPVRGLAITKPGDDHLHWAQIDFVRRVSLVTFGFFDTVQPNRHDLTSATPPLPGLPAAAGRPDFSALNGGEVGLQEISVVLDPPANQQPGGTQIAVELRAADGLTNATLYDPLAQDGDKFDQRGNLLNPNYACEAYRYAMQNPGIVTGPRVEVDHITQYLTEDTLNSARDPLTGLLPRYVNLRLVMENNVDSSPTTSPSLRGMGIVYRMAPK